MERKFKSSAGWRKSTRIRSWACLLTLSWSILSSAASVSVDLGWKPSPSPEVVAYKLYLGTSSGTYDSVVTVGAVTNTTLSQLQENTTYVATVTAVDSAGLESVPASEISFSTPPPPNAAPVVS